jgi:hypothetical protein
MGRPVNKKYFGKRNAGVTGSYNRSVDPTAKMPGQEVASVGSITAGTYTSGTPGLTFPLPLAGEGITAARATGTAIMTAVSASIGGTQTEAYSATDVITLTTALGVATFTPTLTTYSANTISTTAISGNAITLGSAISAVKGTSFVYPTGATGVTGLTAGTTYYIAATVASSTTITLSATPGGTVLTISGTPGGTNTAVIGSTLASIASVAVLSGGAFTNGITTSATATTASVSAGAGLTLTVTYGISGATITNSGSGYSTESFTNKITGTTAVATITTSSLAFSGTAGQLTLGTAQTAGTFYVGQQVSLAGTFSGTGAITSPSFTSGNVYTVTATDGTTNLTLAAQVNGVQTALVTVAGTFTGITLATTATWQLSDYQGVAPSAQFVLAGSTLGGIAAGTYYVASVTSNGVVVAQTYAGFFNPTTSNLQQPTTATANANNYATLSQWLGISVSGSGGGAMSAVLSVAITSGYSQTQDYPGIVCSLWVNGQLYEECFIVKQEGSRSYRVLNPAVNNDPGTFAELVGKQPSSNTAPQMAIGATDSAGNTYYIYKLTNKKAYLVPAVLASGQVAFQFPSTTTNGYTSYSSAIWTSGGAMVTTAVSGVSVVIDHA